MKQLIFEKYFIECENDAYVIKKIEDSETVDKLEMVQSNGVDTEDRILKFKNWDKKNIYCK